MITAAAPVSGVRSFATLRSVVALMLREMVTTYGRSPGGYFWALFEPIAAIVLLSFVFSQAFRSPSLGQNFPLFYASAYLPFMLFMDINNKLATAIRFSKPLLAYPAITMVDVLISRFLLNFLTHLFVFAVVITGIIVIFDINTSINMVILINIFGMTAVLAFGTGTLNCYLFSAFPVYERLWQIATRPLVIVSGLFFLFESMPEAFQDLLWYNPLFHVTGGMRSAIYSTYDPTYVSPIYVYLLGMTFSVFGLLILKKNYRDILNI